MKNKTFRFDQTILAGDRGGAFVVVPEKIIVEFNTRGRIKIKASIDAAEYRGSVAPMGGRHVLGITKAIRSQINKDIGDSVHVILSHDLEERVVEVPAELDKALGAEPEARDRFNGMSYTSRKEFARWISDARKRETRERRLKKAIAMIINGEKL
ncbi:MAG: DUF1905 domain-containing protein [Rhodothermales bacterium]|nr:DUF1905 domain-containing protein [Rhodothermales bacterium]